MQNKPTHKVRFYREILNLDAPFSGDSNVIYVHDVTVRNVTQVMAAPPKQNGADTFNITIRKGHERENPSVLFASYNSCGIELVGTDKDHDLRNLQKKNARKLGIRIKVLRHRL